MNKEEWLEKLSTAENYYDPAIGGRFISNSHIGQLLRDPASYGEKQDPIESVQLLQGSYLHDLMEDMITGSKIIEERYTVTEEYRESIAFKQDFITADEVQECKGWQEALMKNKTVQKLLEGEIEVEKPMIGQIDNLPFKSKADVVNHTRRLIVDWKTTAKNVDSFGKFGFETWNYDSAAYLYRELAEQTFGQEYNMVFAVVSKKDGKTLIYFPTENQWYRGRDKVELAIRNYKTFV